MVGRQAGFALFNSAIGTCGVSWGAAGIKGLLLPEADTNQLRARLQRREPEAREVTPPADVERAMMAVVALTHGAHVDLTGFTLDMRGLPEFCQRVYVGTRSIGPGETLTYGELARRIQVPGSARAVGQALGRNPFAIIVPCHRVIAADGKLGGFSAPGGLSTKQTLLEIERAGGASTGLFR